MLKTLYAILGLIVFVVGSVLLYLTNSGVLTSRKPYIVSKSMLK